MKRDSSPKNENSVINYYLLCRSIPVRLSEHKLRVLSHLALCFGTWCVSPLSSVRLGICEHGNRARIRAKTIGLRSPERGGLGSIENELWSGSVAVRKQSDPTDQAISHCIMGRVFPA